MNDLIKQLRAFEDAAEILEQANSRIDVGLRSEKQLNKRIEKLEAALDSAQLDLCKCRESRLAGTIRDLPQIKAAFERIKKLEAALRPFADAHLLDNPQLVITIHDLRMAHEALKYD